jgi:hypothetical protein
MKFYKSTAESGGLHLGLQLAPDGYETNDDNIDSPNNMTEHAVGVSILYTSVINGEIFWVEAPWQNGGQLDHCSW